MQSDLVRIRISIWELVFLLELGPLLSRKDSLQKQKLGIFTKLPKIKECNVLGFTYACGFLNSTITSELLKRFTTGQSCF